jgi:glycosyltransferase involved in cell wall biosynthesis
MTDTLAPAPPRSRPLKIVITTPWGQRLGGAENFLLTFLRHVDLREVRPTVVFFSPGPFEREVAALGIETVVIPSGRLRQVVLVIQTVHALASVLRTASPDLLVSWSPKMHLYGAAAALVAGMSERVTWWQHGVPNGHWLDSLATFLPARLVWCCSRAASQAQDAHWPHRPSVVVYPASDRPADMMATDTAVLRNNLGIPDGRLVVGIVGRLQPWKGQDVFLRALAAISARGYDVHGLVVGGNAYNRSPGYEDDLKALARALDLEDRVTFTGQVPVATKYVRIMDISINASACEPFGLVVLEAMAAGVPVVAFAEGGPAEIIEPGRSGLLAAAGDESALTEAIVQLIDDPGLLRRVGDGGRERAQTMFSPDGMTRQMVRQLRELCPA